MLAKISTRHSSSEADILKVLSEEGMKPEVIEAEGIDVFYNGRFIGVIENPLSFIKKIKEERRSGKLPFELSIKFDEFLNTVFISTEIGRVLRPLIIVDNGKKTLEAEKIKMYIDVDEEFIMNIANDIFNYDILKISFVGDINKNSIKKCLSKNKYLKKYF
jgi:DNA-directed RNA polymerase beta subunit